MVVLFAAFLDSSRACHYDTGLQSHDKTNLGVTESKLPCHAAARVHRNVEGVSGVCVRVCMHAFVCVRVCEH